jgi:hypothetical protein
MQDDEVHAPYPVAGTGGVSLQMPCAPRESASQPDLNQAAHGIRAAGATILTKE